LPRGFVLRRSPSPDRGAIVADDTISAAPGLAINAGSLTLTSVTIDVEAGWTGSQLGVDYSTLPGCKPKTYGHVLGLWQGSIVGWDEMPPASSGPVDTDQEDGSVDLENLTIEDVAYTVAYAVGPDPGDYCAAVTFSPGGQTRAAQVSLSVNSLGATSIGLHYVTLPGYDPAASGNWVGLWKGEPLLYADKPPPLGRALVKSDANEDDVAINGVPLAIGTTYTVAYFMGAALTTAAAQLTFTTKPASAGTVSVSPPQMQEGVAWSFRSFTPAMRKIS
jgi:hypothetical protein